MMSEAAEIEAQLDPGKLPDEVELVWDAFIEICNSRILYEGRPTTSILTETFVWSQLHCVSLQPWEIRALQMLDSVWLDWIQRQHNARSRPTRA